jgi:hypothetical protein
MVTDSVSATRKTTKGVLLVQILSQLSYFTGAIILKGYSGAVQNAVSILRNLVAIRKIENKIVEWSLVILGVVLGIAFNNRGLFGYLPIVANLQYTLVILRCKGNDFVLKISFLISTALFALFNLVIFNFVGMCTNFTVSAATAVFLLRQKHKQ